MTKSAGGVMQAKTKREALAMARVLIHALKPNPRDAFGKRERLEAEKLWDDLCRTKTLDQANAVLAKIGAAVRVSEEA